MKPTVRLELESGRRGAKVAGQVTLGLALRAGLPPLAADRAGADVARAVQLSESRLVVLLMGMPGALTVRIESEEKAYREAARSALGPAVAVRDNAIEASFRRPPLSAV